jgi:hypothetical protein
MNHCAIPFADSTCSGSSIKPGVPSAVVLAGDFRLDSHRLISLAKRAKLTSISRAQCILTARNFPPKLLAKARKKNSTSRKTNPRAKMQNLHAARR